MLSHILAFLAVAIIIAVTPGPDFVLITKNTLKYNNQSGRATAYGVATSHVIFATASVLGLTSIIAKSIVLFQVIKYAGAAYLIYLGIKALIAKKKQPQDQDTASISANIPKSTGNLQNSYFQGMASTLLNPKALIFYISLLPQFIDLGGNVALQSIILAGLFTVVVLSWFLIYVFFLTYIGSWFKKPSVEWIFDKITGITLVSLGLAVALEKK